MVASFHKHFLPVLLWSMLLLSGCNNDIFGLFGSTDLDKRWQARNSFKFLSRYGRNIILGDDYSFIVITDTHINNGDTRGLKKLKSVIDSDPEIKFVVFNGDITQNGKQKDVETFIGIADFLERPCYPVIGNHDIYFGNWTAWEDLIGSTCYRINGDSATLLILDSANAYFGAKQLDWLENELNKANRRVFVFSHVNLFVKSLVDLQQFTDIRERARVTSLLKGRCDAMFMGHVHHRDARELGGVQYITTEDYRDNAVYCQIWVSKNNIRWEFKKL